jgi:hypothetical protein
MRVAIIRTRGNALHGSAYHIHLCVEGCCWERHEGVRCRARGWAPCRQLMLNTLVMLILCNELCVGVGGRGDLEEGDVAGALLPRVFFRVH